MEKECVDARNDHQTEGAAKANIFSFKMACSICDNVSPLDSLLPRELSLDLTMAAESSAIPAGVGADIEDAELVG